MAESELENGGKVTGHLISLPGQTAYKLRSLLTEKGTHLSLSFIIFIDLLAAFDITNHPFLFQTFLLTSATLCRSSSVSLPN